LRYRNSQIASVERPKVTSRLISKTPGANKTAPTYSKKEHRLFKQAS
jgi:hypothetical protein